MTSKCCRYKGLDYHVPGISAVDSGQLFVQLLRFWIFFLFSQRHRRKQAASLAIRSQQPAINSRHALLNMLTLQFHTEYLAFFERSAN